MPVIISLQDAITFNFNFNFNNDEPCHVVCFPVVSFKETTEADSSLLKTIYEKNTSGNYYMQHDASPTARGKLGTYNIHSNKGNKLNIINMFIRLYHGNKTYPNDNLSLRLKYFNQCIEKLLTSLTLETLHFDMSFTESDSEFIQVIEDFWATYKLNFKKDLKIIIYTVKKFADLKFADLKSQEKLETEEYYLVCNDDQISDQPLYEVDFVNYTLT